MSCVPTSVNEPLTVTEPSSLIVVALNVSADATGATLATATVSVSESVVSPSPTVKVTV